SPIHFQYLPGSLRNSSACSLTSAPVQKARSPAPVRIKTPISSSHDASWNASFNSTSVSPSTAFRTSGRLNVTSARPCPLEYLIFLKPKDSAVLPRYSGMHTLRYEFVARSSAPQAIGPAIHEARLASETLPRMESRHNSGNNSPCRSTEC